MLRLRYRKHHRQLISTLCMVFDELLVLEGRGHVSHILWFVSGRMKSWDKQIYRQRVLLLIRQCSHHFHSSHSYLLLHCLELLILRGKTESCRHLYFITKYQDNCFSFLLTSCLKIEQLYYFFWVFFSQH